MHYYIFIFVVFISQFAHIHMSTSCWPLFIYHKIVINHRQSHCRPYLQCHFMFQKSECQTPKLPSTMKPGKQSFWERRDPYGRASHLSAPFLFVAVSGSLVLSTSFGTTRPKNIANIYHTISVRDAENASATPNMPDRT